MNFRTIFVGAVVLTLVSFLAAPTEAASILFDNFDGDGTGALAGETAVTGQVWTAQPGRTTLDTGTQFGQSAEGAGNDNSGGGQAWLASRVPLGQSLTGDGTYYVSWDIKRPNSIPEEVNIDINGPGTGTAVIWVGSTNRLQMGGSHNYGGGFFDIPGTTTDLRGQLKLDFSGGSSTVTFSWFDLNNASNNGTQLLPSSESGLDYTHLSLWAKTGGNNIAGFDNAWVGTTPIPEPSTLTMLGMSALGLVFVAWRRRKK